MKTSHIAAPSNFFTRAKGDLIYALLLLFSTFIAVLLRNYTSHSFRRRIDGVVGLCIAVLISGWMSLCSLLVVLAHLLLLRYVHEPNALANLSFFGTFAYLAVLRTIHLFGLPPLVFVTNAIQLIMTLRVIGLSYEVADMRRAKKDHQEMEKTHESITEPTTFEAFSYLYSFTGLFTGPYYTYRTYSNAHGQRAKHIPWAKLRPLIERKVWTLSWSLPGLVFMTWLDPLDAIRGPQLEDYSLFQLFMWSALAFVFLRMRIYSAWMVAESICLLSGIGIYPKGAHSEPGRGPRDEQALSQINWDAPEIEFDAETINNLDIPHVEHSDGFRSGMRAWNRTVQFWLANFVYRRTNRAYRMPYTMLVSAFWHGIHPGYFLSFLTIPLCTAAEDHLVKAYPERPAWARHLWSFIRMRGFESMACGFLLLDGWDTLRLWSKMYFWLHLLMLGTIFAIQLIKSHKRTLQKDGEVKKEL